MMPDWLVISGSSTVSCYMGTYIYFIYIYIHVCTQKIHVGNIYLHVFLDCGHFSPSLGK